MDCSPPGSSIHGISLGKNTGVGCHFPSPGDLPSPGIKPTSLVSPALQVDSLPAEPQGQLMCSKMKFIISYVLHQGYYLLVVLVKNLLLY